jgi:hypothetical protein
MDKAANAIATGKILRMNVSSSKNQHERSGALLPLVRLVRFLCIAAFRESGKA